MSKLASYTVSARGKSIGMPVMDFLEKFFSHLSLDEIDSVYGFIEPLPFYGGRPYFSRQISENDISSLYDNGINLRIPMTTHFWNDQEFDKTRPIFEKYHRKGNALITLNDDLAQKIRKEYPLYSIEGSVIRNVRSLDRIKESLDIYDTIVLPMKINDDKDFLNSIEDKEKITLFATAGCAYNCPANTCYRKISRINKMLASANPIYHAIGLAQVPFGLGCSRRKMKRALLGKVSFNVDELISMGFSRFKIMRENKLRKTCH